MSFALIMYGFHCIDFNNTRQAKRHCLDISCAVLYKSVKKYENYGYKFSTTVTRPVFMGLTLVEERVVKQPIPIFMKIGERFSR